MKKILCIVIALLMIAGTAFARVPAPSYSNAIYAGGNGQPGTPPMEYVLVRNAERGNDVTSITSGDVLKWDINSGDGFTISRSVLDYGAVGGSNFAGVAVTAIATPDTNTVNMTENNWGYMAIRGYCLAKCDATNATAGYPLAMNGATLIASIGTPAVPASGLSVDIGILLVAPASDVPAPVWLR